MFIVRPMHEKYKGLSEIAFYSVVIFPIILQNELEKLSLGFGGSWSTKPHEFECLRAHPFLEQTLMREVEKAYVSNVHLFFFLLHVLLLR